MFQVAESPDIGSIAPFSTDDLIRLFDTDRPTHDMVASNTDLYEAIGRGQGRYFIVYEDDLPSEIYFCGYSYD